jgi:hypothetical protein
MAKLTPDTIMSGSRLPPFVTAEINDNYQWSTPNLELQKAIDAVNKIKYPEIDSELFYWGNAMEGPIADACASRLDLPEPQVSGVPIFHTEIPLAVSLDRIVEGKGKTISSNPSQNIFVCNESQEIILDGPGAIECKNTSAFPTSEPELWRGPVQLQAQMMCADYKWGAVATLYRGCELRVFLFERHDATRKLIEEIAVEFDRRVKHYKKTGEKLWYPVVNCSDAATTYSRAENISTELSDDFEKTAAQILDNKNQIKKLTAENDQLSASIMEEMKEAETALAGSYIIDWKTRTYKATEEKIVAAREAYTKRSSTLTIKKILPSTL